MTPPAGAGLPAWWDGRPLGPGERPPPPPGRGAVAALYETLLCERGKLPYLGAHLERLAGAADELGFARPRWDPRAALGELVEALGEEARGPLALRLTRTRAGAVGVVPRPAEPPADPGVAVTVAREPRPVGDPLARWKHADRSAHERVRAEARRQGAWDALIPSTEGDLLEGSVANLFAVVDGELRTPPVERGCLPGVLRGLLLRLRGDARLLPVGPGDLARASEVFLTNAVVRIVPVIRVIGVRDDLPGARGAVTAALRERLAAAEDGPAGGAPSKNETDPRAIL